MHLTEHEQEVALTAAIADRARRRHRAGLRLNYPEAVALLWDHVQEAAREGRSYAEVVSECRKVLTADDVLPGVPTLLTSLQVEALFDDGTKLVTIPGPIEGSDAPDHEPGRVETTSGVIELNAGKPVRTLEISNPDSRPVWIGSHFPLERLNPRLELDREAAQGWRLNVPAGMITPVPPGDTSTLEIVPQAPLSREDNA